MGSDTPVGASVHVRRLRPSDKDALRAIRLRSLATDRMAFGQTFEQVSQKDDDYWATWAHFASTSVEGATYVAVDGDGALVGLLGAQRIDGIVWLGVMWVEPRYRRRGIGARLLDAMLSWAAMQHPMAEIRLSVVPSQDAAERLYRSRGFEFTGKTSPLEHTPGAIYREMARPPRSVNA